MKKILIAVTILLGLPTMIQAQTVLTPEQQLEQAQKQLEEAKKAVEAAKAAKIKAEAAKLKAEAEKLKAEADSLNNETKKVKAKETTQKSGGWVIPTKESANQIREKINQEKEVLAKSEDEKYLEGAITLDENGRVKFVLETDANGKTANQIYLIVLKYMNQLVNSDNQLEDSRIALINEKNHSIAASIDEWVVFNRNMLALDRTKMSYDLIAEITDNHLKLTMFRIGYKYEEDRPTGFKEVAEKVIVDKYAMNKKKTKLTRIFGKFRRGTVDRKNEIFNDLSFLVKD